MEWNDKSVTVGKLGMSQKCKNWTTKYWTTKRSKKKSQVIKKKNLEISENVNTMYQIYGGSERRFKREVHRYKCAH